MSSFKDIIGNKLLKQEISHNLHKKVKSWFVSTIKATFQLYDDGMQH